ncbi:methyltransferase [Scopulibacillus daqui]|uniref:Methyltransferase n=2 Tax=Scopulibacillus daqui TaxID=1469162 RepID=A0ABS2PXA5_9BACL|nr:methyltransferase [Scopulibacillus daqui]
MILFAVLFLFVVLQRVTELIIARSNEAYLKSRGAVEIGHSHYKWIVLVHAGFFVSLLTEVLILRKTLASWFWIPLAFFAAAQVLRLWALLSLGRYWNTKIIILPNAPVVARGPYKYLRHPNYLIVATEILTLPLIFRAYFTAFVFTILNIIVLSIRIPIEEKALEDVTDYSKMMKSRRRFIPSGREN